MGLRRWLVVGESSARLSFCSPPLPSSFSMCFNMDGELMPVK